jgi:creatinine amidohydrolase/Fe(II)-dependent formamide hydrolase-like protein
MRRRQPKMPTRHAIPEMHQTKMGNQWYFGMKAHFGVDSRTKLIHAGPGEAQIGLMLETSLVHAHTIVRC